MVSFSFSLLFRVHVLSESLVSDVFCVFVCFLWAFWEYFDLYLLVLFRSEKFIFIICWSISSSMLYLSLIICLSAFEKFNTSLSLYFLSVLLYSCFLLLSVLPSLSDHPSYKPVCSGVVSYAFPFSLVLFTSGSSKTPLTPVSSACISFSVLSIFRSLWYDLHTWCIFLSVVVLFSWLCFSHVKLSYLVSLYAFRVN